MGAKTCDDVLVIRMFLNPTVSSAPGWTGRREKSDHATIDDAKQIFGQHPTRKQFEAIIYVDGTPTWVGVVDEAGQVDWQPWKV
jgi:hypothetical protein